MDTHTKISAILIFTILAMHLFLPIASADEYIWSEIYETDFIKTNKNLWVAEHTFYFENITKVDSIGVNIYSKTLMPSEVATITLTDPNNVKLFHRENVNMTQMDYDSWAVIFITPSFSVNVIGEYTFELRVYANPHYDDTPEDDIAPLDGIGTRADSPITIWDDYIKFIFAELASTGPVDTPDTTGGGYMTTPPTDDQTDEGGSTDSPKYQDNLIAILIAVGGYLIFLKAPSTMLKILGISLVGIGILALSGIISLTQIWGWML